MSVTLAAPAPHLRVVPAPPPVPPIRPVSPGPATSLDAALREVHALAWVPKDLLIGGEWREGRGPGRLRVDDPATGAALCTVADARPHDGLDALAAAAEAQEAWAETAPRERSRILRRAADAMRADESRLAMICTLEMGKPLGESAAEVRFAADYLEWYAEEAVRGSGRAAGAPEGGVHHVVMRVPVGPCLIVTPWNFPLAVPARGVGPALAAGCTVVLRPGRLAPLSALALARILVEAGLPDGVLNVVVSSEDGATDPLLADPRLRKLTFTGSCAVGRHLARHATAQLVRTSLELGGCAPFVVFADADLEAAVEGAVLAKMRNGAQACTSANRFYVQRPLAEEFSLRLADRLANLRIGRGTEPGIDLGPMIGPQQRRRVEAMVADATARGARTVLPGGPLEGRGWFFAPVVLADVPEGARLMQEEIFGPVAPVRAFGTEEEALRLANDRTQGLAAYLYTADVGRAVRLGRRLRAGMVAVNRGRVSDVAAPFGGVGHSGVGRSGGPEGLDEYLETRLLALPA
jgi:succinate-semialdehyde dehydrogenase / glutarate-semialdehyde dehydrogenase